MKIKRTNLDDRVIKVEIANELEEASNQLSGTIELDIENQIYFIDLMNEILDEGNTNIIIDMSNITYVDSSGLWALFEIHKKSQLKNGKVVLLNPNPDVQRVLDITKMSSKLFLETNEESAIKQFVNAV